MTPGTRPERRAARAGPLPARSRAAARMVTMSAIARLLHGLCGPAPCARASPLCERRPPGVPLRRAARPPYGVRAEFRRNLVEQARYRALVADAPDRLGHERRDTDLADILGDAYRLGGENAVGGDHRLHARCRDPRHRAAREHAVADIGRDRFGAALAQRVGGVAQRAGAVDDVVDENTAATLDFADDVHDLGDAGALAPLVDDGE